MTIGVTGATGYLGGAVARRLLAGGHGVRVVVRDAGRLPADLAVADPREATYADAPAMTAALEGVDTLYLVSAAEDPRRVDVHVSAVDAAIAAGVNRIVYVSFASAAPEATFTFARDHFATEVHIRSTGVAHTFLRSALYVDFLPGMVGADGVFRGPAGPADGGRIAWVARDDVADVGAAVVLDAPSEEMYDVTGPTALTVAETVDVLGDVAGRPVRYEQEGLDEARESRRLAYDVPAFEIEGWISTYAAVATGEMGFVADTVPRFTGREATSVRDWLTAHPGALEHLRA